MRRGADVLGVSDATESAGERARDNTVMQIGSGNEERTALAAEASAVTFTTFFRASPAASGKFLVCRM